MAGWHGYYSDLARCHFVTPVRLWWTLHTHTDARTGFKPENSCLGEYTHRTRTGSSLADELDQKQISNCNKYMLVDSAAI